MDYPVQFILLTIQQYFDGKFSFDYIHVLFFSWATVEDLRGSGCSETSLQVMLSLPISYSPPMFLIFILYTLFSVNSSFMSMFHKFYAFVLARSTKALKFLQDLMSYGSDI